MTRAEEYEMRLLSKALFVMISPMLSTTVIADILTPATPPSDFPPDFGLDVGYSAGLNAGAAVFNCGSYFNVAQICGLAPIIHFLDH